MEVEDSRRVATATVTPPAATGLLRAIAGLGPRLHDLAMADDPARLYTLACDALRECGLFACIGELREADGPLHVVATSLGAEMTAALEILLGVPIIGYALPIDYPYDTALARREPVMVEDVTQLLVPFLPHLDEQQRAALREGAGLELGIVAPIVAHGCATGALTVWGPRVQLGPADAPAVGALGAHIGIALENAHLLDEVQAARLAAEEAMRQRDTFLSIISHELRTPLASVRVYLQLAQRRIADLMGDGGVPTSAPPPSSALSPEAPHAAAVGAAPLDAADRRQPDRGIQGVLRRALSEADRLARLITDLLDVSRTQAGKLELRTALVDLCRVVREAVEVQREAHPTRTITLETHGAVAHADADADRIGLVTTNLLTNALRYAPLERPIAVSVQASEEWVTVTVRDEGPGIPPGERERIWERFHRVATTPEQIGSGVGLGLGLYISKTIIEQHGGTVGVQDAPGGGSAFSFALPLAR